MSSSSVSDQSNELNLWETWANKKGRFVSDKMGAQFYDGRVTWRLIPRSSAEQQKTVQQFQTALSNKYGSTIAELTFNSYKSLSVPNKRAISPTRSSIKVMLATAEVYAAAKKKIEEEKLSDKLKEIEDQLAELVPLQKKLIPSQEGLLNTLVTDLEKLIKLKEKITSENNLEEIDNFKRQYEAIKKEITKVTDEINTRLRFPRALKEALKEKANTVFLEAIKSKKEKEERLLASLRELQEFSSDSASTEQYKKVANLTIELQEQDKRLDQQYKTELQNIRDRQAIQGRKFGFATAQADASQKITGLAKSRETEKLLALYNAAPELIKGKSLYYQELLKERQQLFPKKKEDYSQLMTRIQKLAENLQTKIKEAGANLTELDRLKPSELQKKWAYLDSLLKGFENGSDGKDASGTEQTGLISITNYQPEDRDCLYAEMRVLPATVRNLSKSDLSPTLKAMVENQFIKAVDQWYEFQKAEFLMPSAAISELTRALDQLQTEYQNQLVVFESLATPLENSRYELSEETLKHFESLQAILPVMKKAILSLSQMIHAKTTYRHPLTVESDHQLHYNEGAITFQDQLIKKSHANLNIVYKEGVLFFEPSTVTTHSISLKDSQEEAYPATELLLFRMYGKAGLQIFQNFKKAQGTPLPPLTAKQLKDIIVGITKETSPSCYLQSAQELLAMTTSYAGVSSDPAAHPIPENYRNAILRFEGTFNPFDRYPVDDDHTIASAPSESAREGIRIAKEMLHLQLVPIAANLKKYLALEKQRALDEKIKAILDQFEKQFPVSNGSISLGEFYTFYQKSLKDFKDSVQKEAGWSSQIFISNAISSNAAQGAAWCVGYKATWALLGLTALHPMVGGTLLAVGAGTALGAVVRSFYPSSSTENPIH